MNEELIVEIFQQLRITLYVFTLVWFSAKTVYAHFTGDDR